MLNEWIGDESETKINLSRLIVTEKYIGQCPEKIYIQSAFVWLFIEPERQFISK